MSGLATPLYFSGKGRVLVAKRDANGRPLAFARFADCAGAKMELGNSTTDIYEDETGDNLLAAQIPGQKSAKLTLTCKQFTKVSAALGFYSEPITLEAGTVTGETFPTDLQAGDEIALRYGNVTDLVITDSTGTPKTMTKDTEYQENSLIFGNVGILKDATTGTYTEPLKAAYSYATADVVPLFSTTPEDRYIRIEGLNNAENKAPVLIEIFKGRCQPFSSVDWIGQQAANQDLAVGCLYDPLNASNANYGKFARVTFL
jgi:hypothetical protein